MIKSIDLTFNFYNRTKKANAEVQDMLDFIRKKQFGAEVKERMEYDAVDKTMFSINFIAKEDQPNFRLGKWITMKKDEFFRNKASVDVDEHD